MFTVVAILIILISVVLIVLVLIQPGKADLSSTFGGLSSQFGSMFGMQRTVNFLAQLTRYLAIAIAVLILLANKFLLRGPDVSKERPVTEGAKQAAGKVTPDAQQQPSPMKSAPAQQNQQQPQQKK